ncbi:hypothetical protein NESM_000595400 [Novymonas esmeraldas]|uniref:Calpain catalytic domain-containing protein n=1 Tax=Novymonas esmeraldas TaxID=1808958 RepID=A0AAW0EU06_9TRYP
MKAATSAAAVAAAQAKTTADGEAAADAASSPLSLLQFGATLYDAHAHLPEAAAVRLPLTRYADYLHHFGFSMERESGAAPAPVTSTAAAAVPLDGRRSLGAEGDGAHEPVDVAGWGIEEALRVDADARSTAVGALRDASTWSSIAEQLAAPFTAVTWRQTATQCTIKKARCVYMWLCTNMTLQVAAAETAEDAGDDGVRAPGGSRPPSQRTASSTQKSGRTVRKAKEVPAALEPAAPPDPLAVALQTRRAPASVLADVYMRMLTDVGVTCEVVAGQLKGAAPEEAVEWRWNIVTVDGKQHLVDVSAALSSGVLRSGAASSSSSPLAAAGSAEAAGSAVRRGSGGGSGRGKAGGAAAAAAAAAQSASASSSAAASEAAALLGGSVRLLPVAPAAMRRDFFFFAHPSAFLRSHLPTQPDKALVRTVLKALQWGVQPRLTPAFYHYGLQLHSHQTHSAFVANGSPSYLSLIHRHASRTELCCVLYVGTLRTLPEDLSRTAPLGAEWVWQQRAESSDVNTFTLTVPQAGYYVVVVGARSIRGDPYSAVVAVPGERDFSPVVSYEMRVGFTPSSAPVLPRQYLSPSICRLMTPLCAQLAPGRHPFRVMPSCCNVRAVAVVRCGASSAAAAAARVLLCFLTFQPRRAVFEGAVDVRSGDVVEVWVLYGAPDRNGQQLRQRVAATTAPPTAPAATAGASAGGRGSASKAADKKMKKGEAAAEQQRHSAEEAQLASLAQALHRGEVFQRCVGGVEVRHFVSPVVVSIIQPQPTVEQEVGITLRRLAGVTEALLSEADQAVRHQPTPVGSCFGAVATAVRP